MTTPILDEEFNEAPATDTEGTASYAAEVRHQSTLKIASTALLAALVASVGANAIQATRPPKVLFVRIDEAARAEAIKISTTNYIPQTPEIRTALFDWTVQRYRIVRGTTMKDFKRNYYLLSAALTARMTEADKTMVAGIVSGTEPEQDVEITHPGVAPITVTKRGLDSVGEGTARFEIEVRKGLDQAETPDTEKERWMLDFEYVVNPAEASRRAVNDPAFQIYNPLGITITRFFATRELDEKKVATR